jgi:hypothetical protein
MRVTIATARCASAAWRLNVRVAIRIPREWLEKADELAQRISRPGVTMSRTDALRAATAAGFAALEGEGESPTAAKKKAPARKR